MDIVVPSTRSSRGRNKADSRRRQFTAAFLLPQIEASEQHASGAGSFDDAFGLTKKRRFLGESTDVDAMWLVDGNRAEGPKPPLRNERSLVDLFPLLPLDIICRLASFNPCETLAASESAEGIWRQTRRYCRPLLNKSVIPCLQTSRAVECLDLTAIGRHLAATTLSELAGMPGLNRLPLHSLNMRNCALWSSHIYKILDRCPSIVRIDLAGTIAGQSNCIKQQLGQKIFRQNLIAVRITDVGRWIVDPLCHLTVAGLEDKSPFGAGRSNGGESLSDLSPAKLKPLSSAKRIKFPVERSAFVSWNAPADSYESLARDLPAARRNDDGGSAISLLPLQPLPRGFQASHSTGLRAPNVHQTKGLAVRSPSSEESKSWHEQQRKGRSSTTDFAGQSLRFATSMRGSAKQQSLVNLLQPPKNIAVVDFGATEFKSGQPAAGGNVPSAFCSQATGLSMSTCRVGFEDAVITSGLPRPTSAAGITPLRLLVATAVQEWSPELADKILWRDGLEVLVLESSVLPIGMCAAAGISAWWLAKRLTELERPDLENLGSSGISTRGVSLLTDSDPLMSVCSTLEILELREVTMASNSSISLNEALCFLLWNQRRLKHLLIDHVQPLSGWLGMFFFEDLRLRPWAASLETIRIYRDEDFDTDVLCLLLMACIHLKLIRLENDPNVMGCLYNAELMTRPASKILFENAIAEGGLGLLNSVPQVSASHSPRWLPLKRAPVTVELADSSAFPSESNIAWSGSGRSICFKRVSRQYPAIPLPSVVLNPRHPILKLR